MPRPCAKSNRQKSLDLRQQGNVEMKIGFFGKGGGGRVGSAETMWVVLKRVPRTRFQPFDRTDGCRGLL